MRFFVTRIFLSCVTSELGEYRALLAKELHVPGVDVILQERFVNSGITLLEKLDDLIKDCSAVIHLVGMQRDIQPKLVKFAPFCGGIPTFREDCQCWLMS